MILPFSLSLSTIVSVSSFTFSKSLLYPKFVLQPLSSSSLHPLNTSPTLVLLYCISLSLSLSFTHSHTFEILHTLTVLPMLEKSTGWRYITCTLTTAHHLSVSVFCQVDAGAQASAVGKALLLPRWEQPLAPDPRQCPQLGVGMSAWYLRPPAPVDMYQPPGCTGPAACHVRAQFPAHCSHPVKPMWPTLTSPVHHFIHWCFIIQYHNPQILIRNYFNVFFFSRSFVRLLFRSFLISFSGITSLK